MLIGVWGLEKS